MAAGGVFALTVVGRAGRFGTSPLSKRFGASCTTSGSRGIGGTNYNLYLSKFGDIDKPGEVFEVRALIVELAKVVML